MVPPSSPRQVLRFGVFELDGRSGELRRNGMKVRLAEQPSAILQLLLEHPGELVTREQLRQRLWASGTFVDFNLGLNSAIRKLREALGDSAENPRFVETLPRRGYRFIAPVAPATGSHTDQPAADDNAMLEPRVRRKWIASAVVLALAMAALSVAYERRLWRMPGVGSRIQSLAVLPFDNLTGDPAQEHVVYGITDGVTTYLEQFGDFDVISRASAMRYKRAETPDRAHELGVDALIEGSVERSGRQLRITAHLTDAATNRRVWTGLFAGELTDVVKLQQEIAHAIGVVIGGGVGRSTGVTRTAARIVDPEAYDVYLKGMLAAGRETIEQSRTAIAYFEQAVEKQPDFAEAHAAIAQAQLQFLFGGPLPPREVIPKAEAAARKAIQIDETVPQAHRTLGIILHTYYWKWEEGDRELRRSRELSGRSAGHAQEIMSLIRRGRSEEAIAEAERARKLDPRSFDTYLNLAIAYRSAGQFDRAVADIRRGIEMHADLPRGPFQLGVTLLLMGHGQDAIGEFEKAVNSSHTRNPRFQAYLGYAYAITGRKFEARRILDALEARARQQYVSAFGPALIYDALGEKGPALAAFERAYDDRALEFAQVAHYPPFRTIASEPRFVERVRLIGLPR